ncbi:MAG: CDP-6-deoxy-delta-3,4-glucoseen reductase [Gammaproteobacteria bacterium]|nr:CDP-6-deoxy-delta-3,4-glucoseen reductase [Gammaproteobacteria bacterium]
MTDKVNLVNDSRTFNTEAGENILSAGLRQGIVIPHNCRNGFCGSCMGLLHSGTVEYEGDEKPRALTAEKEGEGYVLCCQAHTKGDIELEVDTIDAVADIEIKTLPCKVKGLQKMADDVMLLEIKLPPHEKFEFISGQYLDILLRDGRRRSFSMANQAAADGVIELHIREVPGGYFTGQVFNEMKEKDMLRIQGPFGTFILRDDSTNPIIMIAGGTGFAPLKSMLEDVRVNGCDRAIHLYWGARAVSDLYFDEQLQQWLQELDCLSYTPVLSEPVKGDNWAGATGWVHEKVMQDYPDLAGMDVYASGPPPMINAIQESFPKNGLQAGHLYFDSFEYANDGV